MTAIKRWTPALKNWVAGCRSAGDGWDDIAARCGWPADALQARMDEPEPDHGHRPVGELSRVEVIARLQEGLSQKDVAKLARVSPARISQIMAEHRGQVSDTGGEGEWGGD